MKHTLHTYTSPEHLADMGCFPLCPTSKGWQSGLPQRGPVSLSPRPRELAGRGRQQCLREPLGQSRKETTELNLKRYVAHIGYIGAHPSVQGHYTSDKRHRVSRRQSSWLFLFWRPRLSISICVTLSPHLHTPSEHRLIATNHLSAHMQCRLLLLLSLSPSLLQEPPKPTESAGDSPEWHCREFWVLRAHKLSVCLKEIMSISFRHEILAPGYRSGIMFSAFLGRYH
jgi:hypothetical protein